MIFINKINVLYCKRLLVLCLLTGSTVVSALEKAHTASEIEQDAGLYSALSIGTGWAITSKHIVTNYHVIANARNLRLVKSDGTVASPKNIPAAIPPKRHMAIFSYSEPGVYDEVENMTGSNTIPAFSKNTAISIQRELGTDLNVSTFYAERYRNMYVQLENPDKAQKLCKHHKAQKLIASNSERHSGYHFRFVSYRIYDCQTSKGFSKYFIIERDELYDQYGYELGFLLSFKQFMDLAPFFLDWPAS